MAWVVSWGDETPLPVTELQRDKGSVHAIPKVPDTDPLSAEKVRERRQAALARISLT